MLGKNVSFRSLAAAFHTLSIKSDFLLTLLKSIMFLLIICLFYCNFKILKSPFMAMNLPISPCSSEDCCFVYFEVILFAAWKFRILI